MASIASGDSNSSTLDGQYQRQGSKLTGPVELLLVQRSKTTHAKATSYVLRVHPDGRRSYLSSLWERSPAGTYALEYRGQRYTLTLTADVGTITAVSSGTPVYINRGSGNSIAA